jgi:hypothetical protein
MKESEAFSPTGAENVTWNLDDLVAPPVEGGIESVIAKADAGVDAFAAKYTGKVAGLSAFRMKELLTEYEALVEAVGQVESSAYLSWTTPERRPGAARFCRSSPSGSRGFRRRPCSSTSSGPMPPTMQRSGSSTIPPRSEGSSCTSSRPALPHPGVEASLPN